MPAWLMLTRRLAPLSAVGSTWPSLSCEEVAATLGTTWYANSADSARTSGCPWPSALLATPLSMRGSSTMAKSGMFCTASWNALSDGANSVNCEPAALLRYCRRSAGSSGSSERSTDRLGVAWMICATVRQLPAAAPDGAAAEPLASPPEVMPADGAAA